MYLISNKLFNYYLLLGLISFLSYGQVSKDLSKDWEFTKGYEFNMRKPDQTVWQSITVPHTFNKLDVQNGNIEYYRGLGIYKKEIIVEERYANKRFFLKFEAGSLVTDVFINGRHIGKHKGGYTAFTFEATQYINVGQKNEILVYVTNAYNTEVMPLVGDFNVYGGLHRSVQFIIKDKVCINPLDFGASGISTDQVNVTKELAKLNVSSQINNGTSEPQEVSVKFVLQNAQGKELIIQTQNKIISKNVIDNIDFQLKLKNPILWNGFKNPYLYKLNVSLSVGGKEVEKCSIPIGFRYFSMDESKGFFLNGNHLDLHGVCYHESKEGKGAALSNSDIYEDVMMIKDMGANTIRTSHYPQSDYFYQLCDSLGIVVYTEIPQVGPGGYQGRGFINSEDFKSNGKLQLKEMIKQLKNHPSIVFWGLYNELKIQGDDPYEFIKELNELAHYEDPYRLTMAATFQDNHNNNITDVVGWNRYYGWYSGKPSKIENWITSIAEKKDKQFVALSEYGAGASIAHHSDSIVKPDTRSKWHPEEWQAYYHEEYWKILKKYPHIWGKYIWLMFDFGAAHRSEGDKNGVNDKGLVTADRKIKKDAFYFYKANWNESPQLYLAEKRFQKRNRPKTRIKSYTNLEQVTFYLNGHKVGKSSPSNGIALSKEVDLKEGKNKIMITGKLKGKEYTDSAIWILSQTKQED